MAYECATGGGRRERGGLQTQLRLLAGYEAEKGQHELGERRGAPKHTTDRKRSTFD